ncbi:stage III sporulation protein AF [Lachnospiraceae bacterium 48-21]
MAKKNPYVFTIGFDETDPSHIRAAEILNGAKKKAQLIASAVLSYVDGADSEQTTELHLEALQPLLEKLVRNELEKAMNRRDISKVRSEKEPEQVVSLSSAADEPPLDECMTQDIMNAMDAFRRI